MVNTNANISTCDAFKWGGLIYLGILIIILTFNRSTLLKIPITTEKPEELISEVVIKAIIER